MRNSPFHGSMMTLCLVAMILILGSCASKSALLGKWQEIGRTATLEFSADGTFTAVDHQGMAVSGQYTLSKDGSLRCEVQQGGRLIDVVTLTIFIEGEALTLTSPGSRTIERYRREK